MFILVGTLTASGICIFKIGILLISGKKFKAVCLSFCVTNCNPLTDLPQILIGYLFITTKMSLTWCKKLFRSPDKAVCLQVRIYSLGSLLIWLKKFIYITSTLYLFLSVIHYVDKHCKHNSFNLG